MIAIRTLVGLVVLLFLTWGCGQDTQPSVRPHSPPSPYRYEARFSESALIEWATFPRSGWIMHDSVLTMTGGITAQGVTSGYPDGMKSVHNARIVVDTDWQEGASIFSYGVVCRWTNQGNYRFVINAAGNFAILREQGATQMGRPIVEPLQDWIPHEAIHRKGKNHLKVLLDGPQLTFTVNGTTVATANDDRFSNGVVGLVVEGSQRVDFDRLIVEELP